MLNLLSVTNLSVTFSKQRGLCQRVVSHPVSDCSLDIHEHEFLAVVGESGSGKSLLAHAILGLLPPDATVSGNITYRGTPLDGPLLDSLRGQKLRFIPQSVNSLDPTMTIGEFLRHTAVNAPSQQDVLDVLDTFGIRDLYHHHPHELSGGQLRRVLMASVSFGDPAPRLVIADEPTPGIDDLALQQVKDTFAALQRNGAAILLITHDFPLAMEIADRIAVFKDGRIIDSFAPSTLLASPSLCHEYSRALWESQPMNWEIKS